MQLSFFGHPVIMSLFTQIYVHQSVEFLGQEVPEADARLPEGALPGGGKELGPDSIEKKN